MKVLGVDHGSARVGLAVSVAGIAQPLEVIPAAGAVDAIAERVRELEVEAIVVGLPLRTDAAEGPEAASARSFAARLGEATGLEVALWDERLSSVEAERAMRAAGVTARKQRGRLDKVAATLVLQSYLDAHRPQGFK